MTPKTTQGFSQPIESDSPPRVFSQTNRHTDRPTPLLPAKAGQALEEKRPGDEVEGSLSVSVSVEEYSVSIECECECEY